jgi:hypothetical protein
MQGKYLRETTFRLKVFFFEPFRKKRCRGWACPVSKKFRKKRCVPDQVPVLNHLFVRALSQLPTEKGHSHNETLQTFKQKRKKRLSWLNQRGFTIPCWQHLFDKKQYINSS